MSKTDLQAEITALRKQVADLKESAAVRRRVEDALRTGEELARATLDDCPIPLCRLDENGKLLVANEALALLLGYASRHELQELVSILGLFTSADHFARFRESAPGQSGDLEMVTELRCKGGEACRATVRIRRSEASGAYTLAIGEPRPGMMVQSVNPAADRSA